jgi:hypothetical protein
LDNKLSAVAVASLTGKDFAAALDRAISRSRSVPMIEAKAVEPSPAEESASSFWLMATTPEKR